MNKPPVHFLRTSLTMWLVGTCLVALMAQTNPHLEPVFPFAFQGRWGVIDGNKNVLCEPSFDYIKLFQYHTTVEPTAVAIKNERQGLINKTGKWLIPARYDSIYSTEYDFPSLYRVQKDSLLGLVQVIGPRSKEICKPQFVSISRFHSAGLAVVEQAGRYGVIRTDGRILVQPDCEAVDISSYFYYEQGLPEADMAIMLKRGGQVSFLDKNGQALSPDNIIAEDFAMIDRVPGEQGDAYETKTIDLGRNNWRILITRSHDGSAISATELSGYDLIESVELTDTWKTMPAIAYIIAGKDGLKGILDGEGQVLLALKYDRIETLSGTHHACRSLSREGKLGLAHLNGQLIFPAVFDVLYPVGPLFYLRHADGYAGYGDVNGRIYLPITVPEE